MGDNIKSAMQFLSICFHNISRYRYTDQKVTQIVKSLDWLVTAVESELWNNAKRSCDLMNAPEWWMWCIEVRREAGEVMRPPCIVHTVEFFRWPKKWGQLTTWIYGLKNKKHELFFFPFPDSAPFLEMIILGFWVVQGGTFGMCWRRHYTTVCLSHHKRNIMVKK